MSYSIQHINTLVAGTFSGKQSKNHSNDSISRIVLTANQILLPAESLFFILTTTDQTPSTVAVLYERGIRNFIGTTFEMANAYPSANFILVENVAVALQKLIQFHRIKFNFPVIALAGNQERIPVKAWLLQLLQQQIPLVSNSHLLSGNLAIPPALFSFAPQHQLGLFDLNIEPHQTTNLERILDPDIGIYVNHNLDKNTVPVAQDLPALALLHRATTLIYCKEKENTSENFPSNFKSKKQFTWSQKVTADLQVLTLTEATTRQASIRALYQGEQINLNVPFLSSNDLPKAMYAWSFLLCQQYSTAEIAGFFENFRYNQQRLTLQNGRNRCQLLTHHQAKDLSTLGEALFFLEQQSTTSPRRLILSDFSPSTTTKITYASVAKMLIAKKVYQLVTIGKSIQTLHKFLPATIDWKHFPSTQDFLAHVSQALFQEETILLHGATAFEFVRIVDQLAAKIHTTILDINLTALRHNLAIHRHYLHPETKMMVMVKAMAYGTGYIPTSKSLVAQEVDYLVVAYVDEGVQLRKAGIQTPIFVLNPAAYSFDMLSEFELEPEIYSFQLLKQYVAYLEAQQIEQANIHLKLDTGMHRLGFAPKELPELLTYLATCSRVKVCSVLTHLVGSENKEFDDFSIQQIELFEGLYKQLAIALKYHPLRHVLNSNGIVRFPKYQFEMVRLGIGLYGIDNNEGIPIPLRPIHRLKTSIAQIRTVLPHETVGYSRKGSVTKPSRVATISVGYGDGLLRGAGNRKFQVLLRDKMVPILGNICMDMCMIDVTQVPEAVMGDEVIIFESQTSVRQLAHCLDTITYEVFTNISERVKKIHFEE
ncbi:MAG: alanine racemase [Saprospiraceae bacterium]